MQWNGAFQHLILNHVPLLMPMIGIVVLAVGLKLKLLQTQMVGVTLIVIGALAAIAVYLTGFAAREVVQNFPAITTVSIEQHKQAALYAFIALETVGAIGLYHLWTAFKGRPVSRQGLFSLLIIALVASVMIGRASHLGGLIRHEEVDQGSFTKP